MSVPDIILPINNTGLQAWVWIESVEITRQGRTPVPDGDKWRVALPLRASLAQSGVLLLDDNGNEMPAPIPASVERSPIDVALLIHHAEVATLMSQIRDTCIKIVNKQLTPAQEATP